MIRYGSYDIDLDLEALKLSARDQLSSETAKVTGLKKHNRFNRVDPDRKRQLQDYCNKLINHKFDWNFDYFHSGEPVGLHTDNDTVPWNETVSCRVDVGVIIPLEWNCQQPYTVNYDRISSVSKKMMYSNGEMRYKHNNEIFTYRNKWEYDEEVLRYNPMQTMYAREYADLKVHSVYEWKIGTAFIFDTARWHSSSWFLSTNDIPDISTEYKRSIIGFGSTDV